LTDRHLLDDAPALPGGYGERRVPAKRVLLTSINKKVSIS
jgi:hypothetical protein